MVEIKRLESSADAIRIARANGEVIELTTNGHVRIVSEQDINEPQYGWFLFERRGKWRLG